MNAPARPVEEIQAMKAYGWTMDDDGDYYRDGVVLMAPYWDECQGGFGRLNELWELRPYRYRIGPEDRAAFDDPLAAALYWALEQSNN